jgi:type IX secretion system PorP/SprF family membrane protein
MKRLYYILGCLLCALAADAQQDPQYNLYQYNQMVINPAYAGARDGLATIASIRQQWSGFSGAPRTACFSAHGPLMNKKLGVGFTFVKDVMGPRNMDGAYANIAYILKLGAKLKLSFGLNAGVNSYKFDFNKLTFKSVEANAAIGDPQRKTVLDMNTGLFLRSNSFFLGLSITHLNSAKIYDYQNGSSQLNYKLAQHAFITAGKSWTINDNVIFAPTIMLKSVSGRGAGDLNINFFLYKRLWLGVFYKSAYGPGMLLQFYVNNQIRVAYSYDTGVKDVRKLGAAHEVMIGFDFKEVKSKVISPRFL